MRFGILGPTQVRDGAGRELPVGGRRLRALLVRLLIDPGRVVGTGRLIDDLYGADPPAGAANALQSQVSRLRRTLPDPSLVELQPAGYRLAVDPEEVDAHRFGRLAGSGRRALAAGDHRAAAATLREALSLWRGPALADVRDAPYAASQAARWEEARLAATEDRIEAELALGAPDPAELQQLVSAHPLRERLHGQLIRALYQAGRPAEALAGYERARQTLAEELGADPSPELAALHRAVLRGDPLPPTPAAQPTPAAPQPAPPASALDRPERASEEAGPGSAAAGPAPGAALPGQLTSFVGREEEQRRVGKLVGEARLVTITGPGGAGKTRLAVEAAGQQPGEACFVELAGLRDGSEVPLAVRDALGLRDAGLRLPAGDGTRLNPAGARPTRDGARPDPPGQLAAGAPDPTDRLVAALADRPVLLLLDNCEHLVAAAAALAGRLLAGCPRLRVLATSREPLGLTGEALVPLSGLPLPPPETAPEHTGQSAAVRLFLDRAADAAPAAEPDRDLSVVDHICRTLDGLPLAIELAAARLRSMPITELAARLDDRFRLLSRGSRTAAPRHRTLRAVVQWSWELLSEPERALARRLTTFAGSASLAAVEQVCQPLAGDPVELLAGLVDKSLVEVTGDGRYRMLQTIRAYAAERLAETGEVERMRAAHASYLLDLARTADRHLRTADQLGWLSRLDDERDNLHAALRQAVAAGDHPTGLRLVGALTMYWWLRGLRGQAATLAGELLAAVEAPVPADLDEEYALCVLVATLGGTGTPDPPAATWSIWPLLSRLDGAPRQPFLLFLSSLVDGPPEGEMAGLEALLAEAAQWLADDPWVTALTPIGIGALRLAAGQFPAAEQDLTTALARFRAIGERWGMLLALAQLAELAGSQGEPAAAIAPMDEALRLAGELGSTLDMAELLRTRGGLRLGSADRAGARADFQQASELARRAGAVEVRAAAELGLGELARIEGDPGQAERRYQAALASCPAGWYTGDLVRAEVFVGLGRLAEAAGAPEPAAGWYRQAIRTVSPVPASAVEGLAGLALRAGNGARAARLLGAGAVLHAAGLASPVGATGLVDAVRGGLGEPAYRRAYGHGAALPADRARELLAGTG